MRNTLEKMLRAGHFDLVLQEADAYFDRRSPPSQEDAWVCVHAALAASLGRAWGRAADWAENGLRLSRQDPEAEGRLRFYAGLALFYTSDFYGAQDHLERFLRLSERTPGLEKLQGDARYNLAYVMRALRRRKPELELFRQAAEAYGLQGLQGRVNVCHYEVAWACLLEEEPARALPDLQAAQAGVEDQPDRELETDVQTSWALYHHLVGQHRRSEQLCVELLDQPDLRANQRSELMWILARNALASGDLTSASRYANEAYAGALSEWVPTQFCRMEALRSQVLAASQRGR